MPTLGPQTPLPALPQHMGAVPGDSGHTGGQATSHEPEGAIAQATESRASVPRPAAAGLCSLFVSLVCYGSWVPEPCNCPRLFCSRAPGSVHSQDDLLQAGHALPTCEPKQPAAGAGSAWRERAGPSSEAGRRRVF